MNPRRYTTPAAATPSTAFPLAIVLFGLFLALSAFIVWRSIMLQPFSDMFDWVARYYQMLGPRDAPGYLWAPHNFHRIVWTFALLGIDMSVFGGAGWPFVVTSAACLATAAALLGREAWRAGRALRLPMALVAAMLALTPVNLMSAGLYIQANYLHAIVFAVATIVVAEPIGGGPPSLARRCAALALAVAAAFGNAVGLALWPVLAFAAWRQGRFGWLATVVVLGAAFVALYAAGQTDAALDVARKSADLRAAALILLSYLGLPWNAASPIAGRLLGAVILALSGAALVLKGGPGAPRAERVAVQLILFSLGTAVMAALGRTALTTPEHLSVRYAVLLAPLHVGLLILVAPAIEAVAARRAQATRIAMTGVCALLLAQQAVGGVLVVRAVDAWRLMVDQFRHGVRTSAMAEVVHPRLAHAAAISARLKRDGRYQRELHLEAARRDRLFALTD